MVVEALAAVLGALVAAAMEALLLALTERQTLAVVAAAVGQAAHETAAMAALALLSSS